MANETKLVENPEISQREAYKRFLEIANYALGVGPANTSGPSVLRLFQAYAASMRKANQGTNYTAEFAEFVQREVQHFIELYENATADEMIGHTAGKDLGELHPMILGRELTAGVEVICNVADSYNVIRNQTKASLKANKIRLPIEREAKVA